MVSFVCLEMVEEQETTHFNNVQGLVNAGLGVERETGIDLSGDLAGNNLQDLLAKLNQETVKGSIDLGVDILAGLL